MGRVAYVNGRYVRQEDAVVNIEDRGYQFADGVCEFTRSRQTSDRQRRPYQRRLYSPRRNADRLPGSNPELVMRRLIRKSSQ